MGSGKQVLLRVLKELSQKRHQESELEEVSETLRSALCCHCSTSPETMNNIVRMGWLNHTEEGEVVKQGIGLAKPNVFLSDLLEELIEDEEMPDRIRKRFPSLTEEEYGDGLSMIWWLLSSLQYWEWLSSVENEGVLEDDEYEKYIELYKKSLKHFRNGDF